MTIRPMNKEKDKMNTEFEKKCDEIKKYYTEKLEIFREVDRLFEMNQEEFKGYKEGAIRETLLHAKKNSAFYQKKLNMFAFDENFFKSENYMEKIPFTQKAEIVKQYPFGMLSANMNEIVRYGESSGTTAVPINAYYTREDWISNNATVAKWLSGIVNQNDIAAVIVPYELALVGQDLDRALEIIGATTIAIGSLTKYVEIDRVIDMLKSLEVTTVVCSPTRLLFIAEEAEKLGYNIKKDFRIKKLLCSGEGASHEKARLIKEIWGAEIYPMYGMTETNTMALPCSRGHLHLVESKGVFEIVDPVTGEQLGENTRGELVVTTLQKGMPLIRYRTGDLCTISTEESGCGCETRILKHHGRITDHLVINDKVFQILDLEEVILSVSRANFYTLKVLDDNRLEVGLVLTEEECNAIKLELEEQMMKRFGIPVRIMTTSMKKIEDVIKVAIKPSLRSILLK